MNVMEELVDFLHGRFAGHLCAFRVLKQRTLEKLFFLTLFQVVMIDFVKKDFADFDELVLVELIICIFGRHNKI